MGIYQNFNYKKNKIKKGYNSEHARVLFPKLFNKENTENTLLMTIFFGANDAATSAEQALPVEKYTANIKCLVEQALAILPKDTPIIVITPPPCNGKMFVNVDGLYNHDEKITETYRNACIKMVHENFEKNDTTNKRVFLLDIWPNILGVPDNTWVTGSPEFVEKFNACTSDGLHLNDKGNNYLVEGFMEVLSKHLPHLLPENLKMLLPAWTEIDPNAIEKCI